MESLHDHHLRSFSVFEGVEAYVIAGDALGTIFFAVAEADPLALYKEYGESMRLAYEQSGGHAPWVRTSERAREFFSAHSIQGYALNSSIGLTGAIWAKSYSAHWLVAPTGNERSQIWEGGLKTALYVLGRLKPAPTTAPATAAPSGSNS